jgi:phenylpropionate dioxygenase-like ring-hydroxylating dioxygenase large terminal subunit
MENHGWSYDLTGRLRGIPHPSGYAADFNKNDYPLASLRVEEYAGLIFATFRNDIGSLADYLGPAKKWIDLFMKQGAGYAVAAAGEHRFRFQGNWKIQLENTTDAYHFPRMGAGATRGRSRREPLGSVESRQGVRRRRADS